MRLHTIDFLQIFYWMLLFAMFFTTSHAANNVYRWVDKNGNVHYSHTVPIEASQVGHSEINKQGAVVNKVESRYVKEQRLEKKRLEALQEELEKDSRNDSLLKSIYANEDDLKEHFNVQIKMISTNVRLLEYNRKQLWSKIVLLKKEYQQVTDQIKRQAITLEIEKNQRNLAYHDKAINENRTEQHLLDERMRRILGNKSKQSNASFLYKSPSSRSDSNCDCSCKKR